MNKEEALQATKTGAILACISGTLTLAVSLFAIWTNSSGRLELWNDPLIFIDIFLIFFLAYGIYKKSLTAAVVMIIYFIYARIFVGIETGQVSGIVVALVFLYFFGKAAQGAFVLQKIEKAENPDKKAQPKWITFLKITGLFMFLLIIGFGLLSMTGAFAPTEVLSGNDLSEDYKKTLINSDIIYQDDDIQYFYSDALFRIEEMGSILTSDRVIMYFEDENEDIAVYELYFEDITDVELFEEGNFFYPSVYRVYADSRDAYLTLWLSTENRGDIKFIEALRSELKLYNQK